MIDAASWRKLESGLQQRVRLLEAVLNDLLGPQRLLKARVLPPELLWTNPFYDRVYHEVPGADGRRLHVTATDLARDNDGSWWVTSDRTRAPSGLGYLLENRIVTGRVFPQLIRRCYVRRLAQFFSQLRESNAIARSSHARQSENRTADAGPGKLSPFRRRIFGKISRLHPGARS